MAGPVVLSLKKTHGFEQKTTTPATVNPSLWRQTRLNGFQGLFKVADRVYQSRGLGDSNMTIVESDTGVIVVDTLIATETAQAGMHFYFQHRPPQAGGRRHLHAFPRGPHQRGAGRRQRGRRPHGQGRLRREELLAMLDDFSLGFPIVEPRPAKG
jgi:alkyl sulfatase BDS1-like metallo-beta-lactamase superfamily hydrolase